MSKITKLAVMFVDNIDISGKISVSKGEVRNAEMYDGYIYIDFGKKGVVKVPENEMEGNFVIL